MPLPSVLQHWRLGDRRDIQCEKNLVALWETFVETGLTWSNLWKRMVKQKPKAAAAESAALSFRDAWPKVSKHWRHKHSTTLCTDYLSRFCTLLTSVPGRPLIRSADTNKLLVPRSCMTSFGLRSFGSSGPTAWNDMPAHLCNLDLSLSDFRQLLKTALFQTVPV